MRTLGSIIMILALLHALAFGGLLGWVMGTGRLDRSRFDELVELFRVPVDEARAKAKEEADAAAAAAAEAARLGAIDSANLGAENRLVHLQKLDELLEQKRERDRLELERMRGLLADQQAQYDRERAALEADRKAFEAEIERRKELVRDEQFQKMMSTFEGLPAGEQKLLILEYIARGEQQFALDIINNLPKRTAQNLLKQFENEGEVGVAADLLKQLIDHGA